MSGTTATCPAERAHAAETPPRLKQSLAEAKWFLAAEQSARHVIPTRTFTKPLTLQPAGHKVRSLRHDRAVTPNDAASALFSALSFPRPRPHIGVPAQGFSSAPPG